MLCALFCSGAVSRSKTSLVPDGCNKILEMVSLCGATAFGSRACSVPAGSELSFESRHQPLPQAPNQWRSVGCADVYHVDQLGQVLEYIRDVSATPARL